MVFINALHPPEILERHHLGCPLDLLKVDGLGVSPQGTPCSQDNTDANLRLDYTLGGVHLVEVCRSLDPLRMHLSHACKVRLLSDLLTPQWFRGSLEEIGWNI